MSYPIWIQMQGSHTTDAPEAILHAMGKPFLFGHHQLDDPRIRPEMDAARAKSRGEDVPTAKRKWTDYQMTERLDHPADPPVGGYEPWSWAYLNKADAAVMTALCQETLDADKNASLLLCVGMGYLTFRKTIDALRQSHPGRAKVVYRHYDWAAWRGDDAATIEDTLWHWDNADCRVVTPGMWEGHGAIWHAMMDGTSARRYICLPLDCFEDMELVARAAVAEAR